MMTGRNTNVKMALARKRNHGANDDGTLGR